VPCAAGFTNSRGPRRCTRGLALANARVGEVLDVRFRPTLASFQVAVVVRRPMSVNIRDAAFLNFGNHV
jgi:hypothetical protein